VSPHTFANVLVLQRTNVGWLCEIEHRPVFVGQLQVQPGTSVPRQGQRGPLTIRAESVADFRETLRRIGSR
jgi:hypothetical protein